MKNRQQHPWMSVLHLRHCRRLWDDDQLKAAGAEVAIITCRDSLTAIREERLTDE